MRSKILIDFNDGGSPVVRISGFKLDANGSVVDGVDVRDKLVKRFLEVCSECSGMVQVVYDAPGEHGQVAELKPAALDSVFLNLMQRLENNPIAYGLVKEAYEHEFGGSNISAS